MGELEELLARIHQWRIGSEWIWSGIDWMWLLAGMALGALFSTLFWLPRIRLVSEREQEHQEQIGVWQENARRQFSEISRREKALHQLEEDLKNKAEQVREQIGQIRGWVDQVARRQREAVSLEPDALPPGVDSAGKR